MDSIDRLSQAYRDVGFTPIEDPKPVEVTRPRPSLLPKLLWMALPIWALIGWGIGNYLVARENRVKSNLDAVERYRRAIDERNQALEKSIESRKVTQLTTEQLERALKDAETTISRKPIVKHVH